MKSKSTAILLAIFLGGLGIHRFYLEKPFSGVMYLLFSWTFVPLILSVIEVVVMLFTPKDVWQRQWQKT